MVERTSPTRFGSACDGAGRMGNAYHIRTRHAVTPDTGEGPQGKARRKPRAEAVRAVLPSPLATARDATHHLSLVTFFDGRPLPARIIAARTPPEQKSPRVSNNRNSALATQPALSLSKGHCSKNQVATASRLQRSLPAASLEHN